MDAQGAVTLGLIALAILLVIIGIARIDVWPVYTAMLVMFGNGVANLVIDARAKLPVHIVLDAAFLGLVVWWTDHIRRSERKRKEREANDGPGQVVALGDRPDGDHRASVPGQVLYGQVINRPRRYTDE